MFTQRYKSFICSTKRGLIFGKMQKDTASVTLNDTARNIDLSAELLKLRSVCGGREALQFEYLKEQCEGTAYQAVAGFELSDASYKTVVERETRPKANYFRLPY